MQYHPLFFSIYLKPVRSVKIAHEKNLSCLELIFVINLEILQTYTHVPCSYWSFKSLKGFN